MSDDEMIRTLIVQVVLAILQAVDHYLKKQNKEITDDRKNGNPPAGGSGADDSGRVSDDARPQDEGPGGDGQSKYGRGSSQSSGDPINGGWLGLRVWACIVPLVVMLSGCGSKAVTVEMAGSATPPTSEGVLFGARASCMAHTYAWGKPALAGQVSCLVTAIPPAIKCTGAVPILGD